MAKIETLQDNFSGSSLDATKWVANSADLYTTPTPNSTYVSIVSGRLQITTPSEQTLYNSCISVATYDLTGSYVSALVQPATVNPFGSGTQETYLSLDLDINHQVYVYWSKNGFMFGTNTAGTTAETLIDTYPGIASAPWWRIRHNTADGKLYAGWSADGRTWSEYATGKTVSWDITATKITLVCGKYGLGSPGLATFDNINITPPSNSTTFSTGKFGWGTFASSNWAGTATAGDLAVPLGLDNPAVAETDTATPDGLPITVALDPPAITDNRAANPDDLAITVALDDPTVTWDGAAVPDGIAIDLALDDPAGTSDTTASPDGIAITVVQDPVDIGIALVIAPDGINVGITLDGPLLDRSIPEWVQPPVAPTAITAPQYAFHLMGIGPTDAAVPWRGAPNHGVTGGRKARPARPAIRLPEATSRSFTLRLDGGAEARTDHILDRHTAIVIEENLTDLWWRRRDPVRQAVEPIGRFNADKVDLSGQGTQISLSVNWVDYRTLLEARLVLTYIDGVKFTSSWVKGTTVAGILQFGIPANTNIDTSALSTVNLGTTTEIFDLPPGTSVGDMIKNLQAVSSTHWEWWIDLPDVDGAPPVLQVSPTGRGHDRGVVLFDIDGTHGPIESWQLLGAGDAYANVIFFSGSDAGYVYALDSEIAKYGERDAQDANTSLGTNSALIQAAASKRLRELSDRTPNLNIVLRKGFWQGRGHIDVGDWVQVRITLGKEAVIGKYRVTELSVEIDSGGEETVSLSLGTPRPSADSRSRYAPTARLVRKWQAVTPKGTTKAITAVSAPTTGIG